MKKEKNQLVMGSVLSYLQMGISVIIGLLYTPVMIRLLGKSEYGLYNTVSSTIAMLSILSLGFNSSYIRFFSKYKIKDDKESIYKLNGLYLIIFLIIGLIGLACGLLLTGNLKIFFDEGLTETEYEIAKKLMFISTINLAISFPMSVFSNIISANERFIFLKLLAILKNVVSPVLTLPLLLLGYKSVAMVLVTVIVSVITDLIYMYYLFFVLKNKFIFKNFEKGIFKNLLVFTSFIAINIIVDQINWNIDKFLLARFKGTEEVAIYSVGFTLYQYFMMFSTSISGVFTPKIHKLVIEEEPIEVKKKNITNLFVKVGRIQFIILALVFLGLVFFGKPFIKYWAGEGYDDSYFVVILLTFSALTPLIQNLGIEVQRAMNKHKFRSILYLIMALINLGLSIILAKRYGAKGSIIGTAISLILVNGIIMNIYYHKECLINIIEFWKNILRLSLGLIIPIIVGILIMVFININSIWLLILLIIGFTIVYCVSMWFLGINKEEKDSIILAFRRVFKHDRQSE